MTLTLYAHMNKIKIKKKPNFPLKINEPMKKWATELNRTFQKKKSKWPKNTWKNAHHL
jgi:hypothetical protein